MFRAFQGANGWYVAFQNAEGYHRQPAGGGSLTEAQAKRKARERNADEGEPES